MNGYKLIIDEAQLQCTVGGRPEQEVHWRQLGAPALAEPSPILQPMHEHLLVGRVSAEATAEKLVLARGQYRQLISKLLARCWLTTRYATGAKENALANALMECLPRVYTPALAVYYQREAWQFLGWLARAAT